MLSYADNVNDAVYNTLLELMDGGNPINGTLELLHYSIHIHNPLRRAVLLEWRNSNIFAQIAETLWVLSGSNNLDWLEQYIPRCRKWADDGQHWRAGYGPRLRHWGERFHHYRVGGADSQVELETVDQIAEVVGKLRNDPSTRQAVISIWDPAKDWVVGSKDYPCNNWLHFIIRNGMLHLTVGVRSNDIIHGFSHADFFAWSVLQELIANWVGVRVGYMWWNATSMHLYDMQRDMATSILGDDSNKSFLYSPLYGYNHYPLEINYDLFDVVLKSIMERNMESRTYDMDVDGEFSFAEARIESLSMLSIWDYLLRIYNYWLYVVKVDMETNTDSTHIHNMFSILRMLPGDCAEVIAATRYLRNRVNAMKHNPK